MNEPNLHHTLVGRKIVSVDRFTDEELREMGWYRDGGEVILILDDGSFLFAQSDSEGNGAGAMMHGIDDECRLVRRGGEV